MTVEMYRVQSAKDMGDFVQVKFKEADPIFIPLEDYFMMAIKLNSHFPKDIYERYLEFQEAYRAYIKVKHRLSLKDQTMYEIQTYCRRTLKLDEVQLECVLDMVKKSHLINDHMYALEKSRYFQETGTSKNEIRKKLKKVGIEEKWIEDSMAQLSDEKEYENAVEYAKKVLNTIKGKSYRDTKMSLVQKLSAKGFGYDISKSVVDSLEIKEDDNALFLTYNKAKRLYAREKEGKRNEKIRLYCIRKGFSLSQVLELMEGEDE